MGSNLNFKNLGMGNSPLARQSSVYSLTFDEFQSSLGGIGKDFGSMNMDELLKNIWSAEENQNMGSSTAAAAAAALQRQGSLTLPRTLSQKTVDEVWKDMSKDYGGVKDGSGGFSGFNLPKAPTLGEVTLEEFLVRAGVVREDAGKGNNVCFFGDLGNVVEGSGFGYRPDNSNPIGIQSGNLQLNEARSVQQLLPKQPNLGYGPPPMAIPVMSNNVVTSGGLGMVGLGANGVTVTTGSPAISSDGLTKSNGDTSSVSPIPYVFNGGLRGRRSAALEKVVERRHRRMIKNRESAARSRARKQAYTMELEAEVAKLKEENEELRRKQAKMMEMQKNQVIEMANQQQRRSKRQCLRRTQTSPW